MSKRLVAKTEEYTKDGQTKGKYVEIGVILSNENGEYALIKPEVSLPGVLMKQRALAHKNGKQMGDSIMCSIFTNDGQQKQAAPQQVAPQQVAPQQVASEDIPF